MKEKKRLRLRVKQLRKALKAVRDYPPKGHGRRDEDGYPTEIIYDDFAYKRIVDSFREAASNGLDLDRELK